MYETGNPKIDTLLTDLQSHWNGNGTFDEGATVTFSFVTSKSAYNNTPDLQRTFDNFSTFSAAQKAAARDALEAWSNVCKLTFVEVTDTLANHGNMRFLNSTDVAPAAGQAFLPSVPANGDKDFFESAGDVFIDPTSFTALNFAEHGFGRHLLLHEIGHALGLTHPNEVDSLATIPVSQQTDKFTVMTTTANGGLRVFEADGIFSTAPMLFDILAIQHLYGKNTTFNKTATTYAFDDSDIVYETIWDAGGKDTISVLGSNFRAIIDLRAGRFSSVVGSPDGDGAAVQNLAIAFGATIENATGGNKNDTLIGNGVANTLKGNGGIDKLTSLSGDDRLLGGSGNDTLSGGKGNDVLDGGAGNDRMVGGSGVDTYVTDSDKDVIVETDGGGGDKVISSASRTMAANLEAMTLVGSRGIDGTGNGLDNVMQGNKGHNELSGGGGDDLLLGGTGRDTLDGGAGDDQMAGGPGRDTYTVDSASDTVIELTGEGVDRVRSSVDFTLPDHVENLTLIGGADIDGTGNALDNGITGNAGANVLTGGLGQDVLTGAGGADTFRYGLVAEAGDSIADFQAGVDGFAFEAAAFDPIGDIGLGTLTDGTSFSVIAGAYDGTNAGANVNHGAGDASFVFSIADETLYYDPDGAAAGFTAVAMLPNGAAPTASDVEIVA